MAWRRCVRWAVVLMVAGRHVSDCQISSCEWDLTDRIMQDLQDRGVPVCSDGADVTRPDPVRLCDDDAVSVGGCRLARPFWFPALNPAVPVVDSCPVSWLNPAVGQFCQPAAGSAHNPLLQIPVTSGEHGGATFRNVYCAACHGQLNSVTPWKSYVDCMDHYNVDYAAPPTGAGNKSQIVVQQTREAYWNIKLLARNVSKKLVECTISSLIPDEFYMSRGEVNCTLAVDICLPEYNNTALEHFCQSYTEVVFDRSGVFYRNPHCAFCNGVDPEHFGCYQSDSYMAMYSPAFSQPKSYSSLFSLIITTECMSTWSEAGSINPIYCQINDSFAAVHTETPLPEHSADGSAAVCGRILTVSPGSNHSSAGSLVVDVPVGELCAADGSHDKLLDTVLSYITTAFLLVSIVSLVLHLVVFAVSVRTISLASMSLASLSVSLLVANLCFITLGLSEPGTQRCTVLGVVMYISYMSYFLWMAVIAFDRFITLHRCTKYLHIYQGLRLKQYLKYSGLICVCLLCAGIAALFIDRIPGVPPEYYPTFGEVQCWFSQPRALLIFFAVPLGVVMAVNCVFFVGCACILHRNRRDSFLRASRPGSCMFRVCARLSVLMGLSWVLGILAGIVDHPAVWLTFILTNTLQGFFIFISFTLTGDMGKAVRKAVCGSKFNLTNVPRRANRTDIAGRGVRPSGPIITTKFNQRDVQLA